MMECFERRSYFSKGMDMLSTFDVLSKEKDMQTLYKPKSENSKEGGGHA